MRILVAAAVLLVGCGDEPLREPRLECADSAQCDQLRESIALAIEMLTPVIGEAEARKAFALDYIRVHSRPCLRRNAIGGCIGGEFFLPNPETGIVIGSHFWGLLHEGLHSAQLNIENKAGHDWPAAWVTLDRDYRDAIVDAYGADWPFSTFD